MIDRKVRIGQPCVTTLLLMCFYAVWPVAAEELSVTQWRSNNHASGEGAVAAEYENLPDSGPVTAFSVGEKLYDSLFWPPLDRVQQLDENGLHPNPYGVSVFVEAFSDFHVPDKDLKPRVRSAEELSFVSRVPADEQKDFARNDAESEKLPEYLELNVPLSQFFGREFGNAVDEVYIGYTDRHQSSIYGLQGITVEFVF